MTGSESSLECDELLLPGLAQGAQVTELALESGLGLIQRKRQPHTWTSITCAQRQAIPYPPGYQGRYAVRRALGDYRRILGEPTLTRAGTAAQAEEFLSGLAELHLARWTRKANREHSLRRRFVRFTRR